jgi:hypothetical protein
VWRYDTATGVAANFSGNGYERNQNSSGALTTSWAQPSGLSLGPDGHSLFVADSESSTVRRLDLTTGGGQACVGGDPMFSDNLFRFGDKDGSGSDALLQHPLAVLARPDGKGACVAEAWGWIAAVSLVVLPALLCSLPAALPQASLHWQA